MDTLIQSPETGNFQTLGSCPAGFIEHSIKHKNWYGEILDSGWKMCEKISERPEQSNEPVQPSPVQIKSNYTVRRIR